MTVDVMQTFLGKDGARTLFQLQLRPGIARSLKDFSFFPDENELLLPINVEFEVTAVYDLGNELTMVQCTQVESDEPILDIQVDAGPPPSVSSPQQDAEGDTARVTINMDQRRLRVQESAIELLPSLDETTRVSTLLSLLQGEGVHPKIKRAAIMMAYARDFNHESRIRSVMLAFIAGDDQPDLQLLALAAFSSAQCSLNTAEGDVILSLVQDSEGNCDVRVAAVQMLPQLSVGPACPAQAVDILADLFEECVARVQNGGGGNMEPIKVVLALMADTEAVLVQPRVIVAIETLFSAVSERQNGKAVETQALLKLMATMMGQWVQNHLVEGAEVGPITAVDSQHAAAHADSKLQSGAARCFVNITTSLASGTNERLAEEARSILSTFGKKADLLDAAPVIAAMLDRLVDHEAAPFLFTPLLEYYRRQRDAFFEERAKQSASEEKGWDLDPSTLEKLQGLLRAPQSLPLQAMLPVASRKPVVSRKAHIRPVRSRPRSS
jgi:hypothetical protein